MNQPFILEKKLDHVAFIMDGNGRWAKLRGLPRYLGHKEACNRIIELFEVCREFKIKYMSFYAFSTENWNRPADEINHLMDYLELFFHKEIDYLDSVGTRIVVSGDLSRIRPQTRKVCEEAIERTKNNSTWFINVCLNYGSRDEIVRAAKKIAVLYKEGSLDLDAVDETTFKNYFYVPELPDVDLMIRTSGEERLSNFLLYQNAYAEFVFTPVKWPDFKRDAFIDCLKEYQNRNRRYGGLKNE
ncbi:MAG: polyprenyl diphosphate synthase [Bacilli bacterium]|jgi:undecaprenyl diphosphate synthase|nr:polyprenyl diphosphate synthase [Bacilli bacterium]MCH4210454.1 polyprenyl diphosphate synthase [Bacilli bacterium]MCH4228371.1 polyprenyl diphosphate synthase [Bacilli bacterium]MCH4277627.1 polyprenyl diphosphate synthase [Bacilli bacterium]MCI2054813.1 polyprenyl diphosphate synthase [Bacilli bacterium]